MQLTRPEVVDAPRRKPGRGSQVTPAERHEIQRLHLAEGMSRREIARHTGRTRETIAAQLTGDDFERLREQVETDLVETVTRYLRNNADKAAKAWVKALGRAAQKGDHKPAKDLLMHTGVIRPVGEHVGQQVTVVVGMPGHPAMEAPSQEEVDAVIAEEEARRAGRTIDVASIPRHDTPPD